MSVIPFRNLLFPMIVFVFLGIASTVPAAQDPLDQGAADSILVVISQPRLGVDRTATVGIYFFNDVQAIEAASIGLTWNSEKFSLDSVVFTSTAKTAFTIFRYGLYKGSRDSSNAANRFQCSGAGFPTTAIAAGSQPKLIATGYFSVAGWAGGESFCVDSAPFVNASFVNTSGVEYSVNWHGTTCVNAGVDSDGDGVGDTWDNCPYAADPAQVDIDGDGIGDVCDPCTDTDHDGFGNPGYPATTCQLDNCPGISNPGQEDANGNGYGDLCDGDCCIGRVGDANGEGGDEPTIGDISCMINLLFIAQNDSVVACMAEADINQSGGANPSRVDVTIGDISALIDYLFITGSSLGLPNCF
jgi:hypothetical protein